VEVKEVRVMATQLAGLQTRRDVEDSLRPDRATDRPVPVRQQLIVVGVDGSEETRAALAWIAQVAVPGWDVVQVVHAICRVHAEGASAGCGFEDARWTAAEMVVESAESDLHKRLPGLLTALTITRGEVVDVLADMSAFADLVVVGAVPPDRIGARGAGLGVGRALLTRAECPVLMVPGALAKPVRRPSVVALVHHPELPPAVLTAAFAGARRLGCGLSVFSVGTPDQDVPPTRNGVRCWETSESEQLDAALSGWCFLYPEVAVTAEPCREDVADAAARARRSAALIVAGIGAELDDLTSAVIREPTCPVLVVREKRGPQVRDGAGHGRAGSVVDARPAVHVAAGRSLGPVELDS
jgi:nucleotide-binding universal stress UspA family protein